MAEHGMAVLRNTADGPSALATTTPIKLLIDTDMSIDADDVGALCVAHALATRGEAELLAVVHGTHLPSGPGAISVINHYFGRPRIPIGAYKGSVGNPDDTPGPDWTNHGRGWSGLRDPNLVAACRATSLPNTQPIHTRTSYNATPQR
jgi:hypothetical protein